MPEIIYDKLKNGLNLKKNDISKEDFEQVIRKSNENLNNFKTNNNIQNLNPESFKFHLNNCYDDEFKLNYRIRNKENHIYICKNTFVNVLDFELQYLKFFMNLCTNKKENDNSMNNSEKIYQNSDLKLKNANTNYIDNEEDINLSSFEWIKNILFFNNYKNHSQINKEANVCNIIKICSDSIKHSQAYIKRSSINVNNIDFRELDDIKIEKCSIQDVFEINSLLKKENKSSINRIINNKNKITSIEYSEIKSIVNDNLSKCKTI